AITGITPSIDGSRQISISVVNRIKEAGGTFATNKYRGYGVSYAETLEDTWKALVGESEKNFASLEQLEFETFTLIESIAVQDLEGGTHLKELTLSGAIKRAITISKHVQNPIN